MSNRRNIAVGVLGLILSVALLYSVGWLFVSSSKEIKLAVLTAAVSVTSLVYTQNNNSRREIESRFFSQKSKVYEDIISTIGSIFKSSKGWSEPVKDDDLAKKLFDIQTQILIWAGPDVIRAWENMKHVTTDSTVTFANAQNLLAALRRELGHSTDSQLGKFGLIKVYVRKEDHKELGLTE